MYLYREYFKAKVYTIWVHAPLNPKPHRTFKGTPYRDLVATLEGTLFGHMDRKGCEPWAFNL